MKLNDTVATASRSTTRPAHGGRTTRPPERQRIDPVPRSSSPKPHGDGGRPRRRPLTGRRPNCPWPSGTSSSDGHRPPRKAAVTDEPRSAARPGRRPLPRRRARPLRRRRGRRRARSRITTPHSLEDVLPRAAAHHRSDRGGAGRRGRRRARPAGAGRRRRRPHPRPGPAGRRPQARPADDAGGPRHLAVRRTRPPGRGASPGRAPAGRPGPGRPGRRARARWTPPMPPRTRASAARPRRRCGC